MPVLYFSIIAFMRVLQSISNKKTSTLVNSPTTFFHYGAFYQFAAAVFSFLLLFFYGFHGFDVPTFLCAFFSASSCITIVITSIVGFLFFKEKLSLKNLFGVVLGILSIVIVNIL